MRGCRSLPLKGLNVLIAGAGLAGLSSAIELTRLGAKVQVFESCSDFKKQGDFIRLEANASRVMAPWGDVLHEAVRASAPIDKVTFCNQDGKLIVEQPLDTVFRGSPNVFVNRGHVQKIMLDYAMSLGVQVELGARVTEVFDTKDKAGLRIGDKLYEADCVLIGDGVRSSIRTYVTGLTDSPKKSGYAIYRAWFPADVLKGDGIVEKIANHGQPILKIWIASEAHAIVSTNLAMQTATCFLTHKDVSDVHESWNQRGEVQDMLKDVEGWDPELRRVVQLIPPDSLIDHKILWRDPIKNWVSKNGRACLIGDAAHPHLPTSGTGAAQAFEDAATLGALAAKSAEKSGDKPDIPLVFRAYEKLRFERTSLTQRMGWETRHTWHQTDWDAVAEDPNCVRLPQPTWLLGHDARNYAMDNYEAVVSHLQKGTPFVSQNVPADYVHEDWTVEVLLARERQTVDNRLLKVSR